MSKTIKIAHKKLAEPQFQIAFRNLCADGSIGIKDGYALGRVANQISSWQKSYERWRNDLVKQLGVPTKVWLTEEIETATKKLNDAAAGTGEEKLNKFIKGLKNRLYFATDADYMIPDGSPELATYNAELEKELQGEMELELRLDHLIKPGPTSKLTAADMMEVLDFIEEPA